MRVTSGMLTISFAERLHQRGRTLWDAYDAIASGKRVRQPGDDPSAVTRILQLQRQLSQNEQYLCNTGEATLWLELTDAALGRMTDIASRARELAVAGASDTMPQSSRNGLADEIDQLFEYAVQVGNSSMAERHLFAGQRTLTQPYTITATNEYQFHGDSEQITRQIGRSSFVSVNITGPDAASPLLDMLADLSAALRSGDTDLINGNVLEQINTVSDSILSSRAEVGAKAERLERFDGKMLDEKVSLTRQLSDRQDADLAESLLNLKLAEAGYEAALTATARMLQHTLVDYLR